MDLPGLGPPRASWSWVPELIPSSWRLIRRPVEAVHGTVEGVEVLSMVTVVLGTGLGQAGRVPFGVTAAEVAMVADLLPDSQPVGRGI